MAKGTGDLGVGEGQEPNTGFIYVTEPNGTTIVSNLPNTIAGVRQMKSKAVEAASNAAGIGSFGSVQILTIGTGGDFTGIGIAAFNYLANPVTLTALTVQQAAEAIALEFNTSDQTGFPLAVVATAVDDTVFLFAPQEDGAANNGTVITPTTDTPAQITFTTIDFAGGQGSNSISGESDGLRIFLDANYDAAATSCAGDGIAVQGDLTNSIEITDDVIHILPTELVDSPEIVSDSLTVNRLGKEMSVDANTQASAATDDLETISPAGFALRDKIILRGVDLGRVITVRSATGNLFLANGNDFVTGDHSKAITLQLTDKAGPSQNVLGWSEVTRSGDSVASIASHRAATPAIPVIATEDEGAITAADATTITLTANTDERLQIITGADTLGTGDFVVFFSTVDAVAGDWFLVKFAAQVTEAAGNKVRIGGASKVALTSDQALIGGWSFYGYYNGAAWRTIAYPDMSIVLFKLGSEFLLDDGIGPDKVTEEMRTELVTIPISFETDEQGDHKITMPFSGSIVAIDYAVNKDIQAANDGSIVAKDDALAVMATTSIIASSSVGTIFSETPTSTNSFVAGEVLTFSSSKSTDGGRVLGSLKAIRT